MPGMTGNNYVLWQDDTFQIKTPFNPHIAYSEGPHLVIAPLHEGVRSAWDDPELTARAFKLAARACKIMDTIHFSDWFNMQANGNWGLLPGAEPFFHIHVYGRNKTGKTWAQPVALPTLPKTYKNEPMPEADRQKLIEAFAAV